MNAASYLLACCWGIVILLCWIGWGGALNRLLFPTENVDWAQRGAWGLAFSAVFGGILNLAHGIRPFIILTFIALGVCWWAAGTATRGLEPWKEIFRRALVVARTRRLAFGGSLVLFGLFLARYLASVSGAGETIVNHFSVADDYVAYLAFPAKMLQTGSLGADPFSGRRMMSALGGQSFLDTLVVSALPLQRLHVIDAGLGLLLILGLVWGLCREKRVPWGWCLAILSFVLFVEQPTINITSTCTGVALFLSLSRTLAWPSLSEARFFARAFIVALTAAALCSLKSSFLGTCAVVLACSYICLWAGQRFKREAVLEAAAVVILTAAFLLPWMISSYQSSGTLLYPLLGKGYQQAVYGNAIPPWGGFSLREKAGWLPHVVESPRFFSLVVLTALYWAARRKEIKGREAALSIAMGAIFGRIAMTFSTGFFWSSRMSFPFEMAAILVLITEVASDPSESGARSGAESGPREGWRVLGPVVAGCAIFFLLGAGWRGSLGMYADCARSVRAGIAGASFVPPADITEYRALEATVPKGEVILERLNEPFLLDFRRNRIFLMDNAGASPPPGLPYYQGSERLASYLASVGVRYIALSRFALPGGLHNNPALWAVASPWVSDDWRRMNDFEQNVKELARTKKVLYDDGNIFALDLQTSSR